MNCKTKLERSQTIAAITKDLLENPKCSIRFFKRVENDDSQKKYDDDAEIEQLDPKKSHDKIAHALRDYAAQHRKNQEKHERSVATQQQTIQPEKPVTNGHNDIDIHRISPRISELMEQQRLLQEEIIREQYLALQSQSVSSTTSYHNHRSTKSTTF